MKKYLILIIPVFLMGFISCNEDEIFEREQYKIVFTLVSEKNHNVFNVLHDLDSTESTGYIAVSCGGTNPTETDLNITMVQDIEPFDRYNKDNFDMNVTQYAQRLSPAHFSIDDYNITIPKGKRSGQMFIRVRPDGLSPDSAYFIPLKVDSYSAYEVNPDKSDVLYRVRIKNRYATQPTSTDYTNYTLRGTSDGVNVMGTKQMHPVSRNQVRIMAGSDAFQSEVSSINQNCIILTVNDDNKVSISPYRNITVEQVDGDSDFPNIFKIEDDGYNIYKTFLLSYKYTVGSSTYMMKEELRIKLEENEKEKFNL
jgi:hypothetical protein